MKQGISLESTNSKSSIPQSKPAVLYFALTVEYGLGIICTYVMRS